MALFAGAEPSAAARLGVAMTALQFAIGIVNDIVDAERDAGRGDKPIPARLVGQGTAAWAAAGCAATGLVLTLPSGPGTVAVGGLGLGVGLAYDRWFRGTAWSWLPFAIGIPLLPVYAWLGATGGLPGAFLVLLPTAVVAGAGLAVANALADMDVDRRAGAGSVALALGARRAWIVHVALLGSASLVAVGSIPVLAGVGERTADPARIGVGVAVALLGAAIIAVGAALARPARPGGGGWELEAVGLTALAVGWIVGVDIRG